MNSLQSVRHRIISGIKANLLGQGSTIFIQIVSVPLLISYWTVEIYGVWVTLNAIPSYFAISDLGFGSAAANSMTMELAKGNKNKVVEIFQTVWCFACIVSILVLSAAIYIVFNIHIQGWLNITQKIDNIDGIILVLIIYSLSVLQGNVIQAGFKCNGYYPLGVNILNIVRLTEWCAVLLIIPLGADIFKTAMVMTVVRIAGVIFLYDRLQKINPWLPIGFSNFNSNILKKLAFPAITFLGLPLGNAINNQGVLLVIANHIGPTAVASFSALRTLCRLSFSSMNVIRFSAWPEISKAYGSGNLELARLLHRRCCQLSFWIVLSIVIILSFVGQPLFIFWTKGNLEFQADVFYIMLTLMITNTLWFSSSVVHTATNQHQRMTLIYVFLVSLSVMITSFFISDYGLISAAISLLFIDLIMVLYVFYGSVKILDETINALVRYIFSIPFLNRLKK